MNWIRNILVTGIMLMAWYNLVPAQDYMSIVCPGDTGVSYFVEGTEGSTFEWTVNGGEIVRDYGDSVIVNWGREPGTYEMTVQEISKWGCYAAPVSGRVLVSAPDIDLGDDTYVCDGNTLTLSPQGDFYSFLWHDGTTDPQFTSGEEGWISCTVTDQYGCPWTDSLYLEVKPLPYVDLGSDTSLCGEQSLRLSGGTDGINFNWSTGEIAPEITVYQGYKEIWVSVEDEWGCVNSDTIIIDECDPGVFFQDIPTAFTPNGDGRNDVWRLEKLEAYPDAVIEIFDRWGKLVYRSEPGYPEPWNGQDMRGRLVPMDSYHFVIQLNFGEDDRVIGAVTVIR